MKTKAELTHELRMVNKKIYAAPTKKETERLMDKRMAIVRKMKK